MATHFSIYELTTENSQLLPVCIIPDAQLLMDVALKVLWNYNILDQAGEVKLREVMEEVKAISICERAIFTLMAFVFPAPIVNQV